MTEKKGQVLLPTVQIESWWAEKIAHPTGLRAECSNAGDRYDGNEMGRLVSGLQTQTH